jgi:hypothetical protein
MTETVKLTDPQCPLRIEYSKAAMEEIRQRARAGLMAAPRVGMAVGGLLLGVKEQSLVRLLDSVELPCSHSRGPSFALTPEEEQESRDMVAEANALSTTSRVGVVGCYVSKTRGEAVLSDSDRSFFAELFPGAGQIALVLCPDVFKSMRAVFHFRDGMGAVVRGIECEVDEWRVPGSPAAEPGAATVAERAGNVAPAAAESPKVIEIRQPVLKPAESAVPAAAAPAVEESGETRLDDIIGLSEGQTDGMPAAQTRSPFFGEPDYLLPPPQPKSKLPLILGAVALLLVLAAVAFFTQDSWLPKPPLALSFSDDNGSLLIRWNPDALRGISRGSMYVNDGGQAMPSVIPLDRLELTAGLISYKPKSKHVTAKLDAGSVSAFNTWSAPEPPQPQATGTKPQATDTNPQPPGSRAPSPAAAGASTPAAAKK